LKKFDFVFDTLLPMRIVQIGKSYWLQESSYWNLQHLSFFVLKTIGYILGIHTSIKHASFMHHLHISFIQHFWAVFSTHPLICP